MFTDMKGNGFQYFLSVDIQLLDPESGFPGQSSVCTFGTGYDTDTQRRRSSCVNNFLGCCCCCCCCWRLLWFVISFWSWGRG